MPSLPSWLVSQPPDPANGIGFVPERTAGRLARSGRGTSGVGGESMGMDVGRAESSRRGRRSLGLIAAALVAVLAVPSAAFAGLQGGTPAADCQPFSSTACLLPFPNNLYTVKDNSHARDRRPRPPPAGRDAEEQGQRGRSGPNQVQPKRRLQPRQRLSWSGCPGSTTRPRWPRRSPAPLTDLSQARNANAPIVVIDAGHRQAKGDLGGARLQRLRAPLTRPCSSMRRRTPLRGTATSSRCAT